MVTETTERVLLPSRRGKGKGREKGCTAEVENLRSRGPGRGGDVPAAALTAYARAEDRLCALEAGYQTHLAKPVDPSELISTVARLAGRRV